MRIGADKSDMLPLKNLEIHLVNPSTWLNAVITAVRPVLSKELNAKVWNIKYNSNMNELVKK